MCDIIPFMAFLDMCARKVIIVSASRPTTPDLYHAVYSLPVYATNLKDYANIVFSDVALGWLLLCFPDLDPH
jgi:hypothetical protein